MIRLPQGEGKTLRIPDFVDTRDLAATVYSLVDSEAISGDTLGRFARDLRPFLAHQKVSERDRMIFCNAQREITAVRTPVWFANTSIPEENSQGKKQQIFAKPDDYWEICNVEDRSSVTAKELFAIAENYREFLISPETVELIQLAKELKEPH